MHSINEHLTPELEALLLDKSKEAKLTKIKKILSHIGEETNDPETIYATGIAYYFLGDYDNAMKKEEEAFPYFEDEMGIAAIFWHALAAWRAGKDATLLNKHYKYGMLVGHHRSYNRIMAIAIGNVSLDAADTLYNHMFQPLDKAIYGYGYSCLLEHLGEKEKAQKILGEVAADDSFWIAYAYLAAYLDFYPEIRKEIINEKC